MLTLISPAKSLDTTQKAIFSNNSRPQFLAQTSHLITILKKLNQAQIAKLMAISDKLAELNFARFQQFNNNDVDNHLTAILAFDGDVYEAMQLKAINDKKYLTEILNFAQNNLLILSGLYGILHPLDIISPYRLEMSTNFKEYPINQEKNITNLYQFWQEIITNYLNQQIVNHQEQSLINLASSEYFSAIDNKNFKGKIININFQEYKQGKLITIGINAKKARGLMARFILDNKIINSSDLQQFKGTANKDSYQFYERNIINDKNENWLFIKSNK